MAIDQNTSRDIASRGVLDAQTTGLTRVKRPLWSQVWYVLRRWPVIPIFILATITIVAVGAEWVAPSDPIVQKLNFNLMAPTWGQPKPENDLAAKQADFDLTTDEGQIGYMIASKKGFDRNEYILGSDGLGRDVLSRIIHGAGPEVNFC